MAQPNVGADSFFHGGLRLGAVKARRGRWLVQRGWFSGKVLGHVHLASGGYGHPQRALLACITVSTQLHLFAIPLPASRRRLADKRVLAFLYHNRSELGIGAR